MNEFAIKAQGCDLLYDEQKVITQADINRVVIASNFEQNAKDRVARLIVKAKMKIEDAELAAQAIIEEARQEAERLTQQWKDEAKQDAISEALNWHHEQYELESVIVEQLKGRIRQQISAVISHWGADQPPSELLIHRLSALVAKETDKMALTLTVSSSEFEAIGNTFSEQLTIEVDETMQSWEAKLSSSNLSIRLNLKEHLDLLLATFHQTEQETAEDLLMLEHG
ncbi:hypothetical protein [Shewanella surugensis]|uniref:HrpE/YscL family type III secretion apparatus protein n=1 Tax=Shewanella surugensis TaxID=212020 RepID=A0ABT0L7K4_9GAMM|nr:hypothetical protein [Shewanella surugensis]MCL1123678.1 hypothetical protein [Shewanella surugensis]